MNPRILLPLLVAPLLAGEHTVETQPFRIERSFTASAMPEQAHVLRLEPETWGDFTIEVLAEHGSPIKQGEVVLRPDKPFNPLLDIRGESTIRPYEVRVYIYGPVSNPTIQPTSNPPLPETEVMTLLATGTTTAGFEDPEAATARALQLLIEEARRGRISQVRGLRTVLSVLDRVSFQVGEQDPYSSDKYNSATINLTDNWLLRAGLNDEGETRATVTYLFRFR